MNAEQVRSMKEIALKILERKQNNRKSENVNHKIKIIILEGKK